MKGNKPLHVAYRPKKFEDFLGNESTIKCIRAMLAKPNHPRVYMLVGRSGCGKTTLARIIAKEVGCSKHSLMEINASDDRGIETGRAIIQMVKTKPLFGKSRVIIVDEAHRATRDLQESLLKVLEEPPEDVYFILCTTDPQKIIDTIKDQRVSQFELKPLKDEEIKKILTDVCSDGGYEITLDVIDYLVEIAEGIPRKALTALNKIIHLDHDDRSLKRIEKLLSKKEEEKQVIDLCRALINGKDWLTVRGILRSMIKDNRQENFERIRQAILGYMSAVALNGNVPNKRALLIYECFKEPFYTAGKAHLIAACLYLFAQK